MFRSLVELFLARRHSREAWSPAQSALGKDRRVFQRVALQVPCRMDNRLFGLQTQGTAVNLSLGGVGIVAPANWPEGSQVRVYIEALDLNLQGMIVFRKDGDPDSRFGVKFQRLGMRSLFRLRRILRKNYNGPLALQ